MTDMAMNGNVAKAAPSPLLVALKEAAVTVGICFMLSIFMVGHETEAAQGQPLTYVERYSDVFWACIFVAAGRFLLALDRQGLSKAALAGGLIGFVYLFGSGCVCMYGAPLYAALPLPFDEPMVNIIFGLGAVFVALKANATQRAVALGLFTIERREAAEARSADRARRMAGILGPILIGLAVFIPVFMPFSPWANATRQVVDSLVLVMTYVMLGWGLNIVIGLAGLLDLGYVAFYAVGAYTYAKLGTELGFNACQSPALWPRASACCSAFRSFGCAAIIWRS